MIDENKNILNNKINNNDYLNISNIDEKFSSRDLVKVFLYLSKNLNKINEFSIKGIKYWENLGKDENFQYLFKRYKPWSLQTSYRRLFANSTTEEIYNLFISNPQLDLSELIKLVKAERKRTNFNGLNTNYVVSEKDKEMHINKKRKRSDDSNSNGNSNEIDSESEIKPGDKLLNVEIKNPINGNFNKFNFLIKNKKCFKNEKNSYVDIFLKKNKHDQSYSDKLSDLYDDHNNTLTNKILSN
jgi:hypothetical protein